MTAALSGEGAERLRRLEARFAVVFSPTGLAPVLALRLQSPRVARRLLWCLDRLDRYADMGRGRAGAGEELLEELMAAQAEDLARGAASLPKHLGYFIPQLHEHGRQWKHKQAPKVKAEREQRGVRKPRRYAPRFEFRKASSLPPPAGTGTPAAVGGRQGVMRLRPGGRGSYP
jgi:hypothetical protein